MCENHLINTLIADFLKYLDYEQKIREVIRNICKEIGQVSREVITILQVIHYNEAGIGPACLKARELFENAREGYGKLKEAVPDTEYYKYHDHWRNITQRFSFLIALTFWLEKRTLATNVTVAEILGINAVAEETGFHLDIDDYLCGLLQMCSELARLAVNSVTRADYEKPIQISEFVMELNAGFRVLDLKNDDLRKRFEVLKYDMKKIEEVVYDLSIRGIGPKNEEQ